MKNSVKFEAKKTKMDEKISKNDIESLPAILVKELNRNSNIEEPKVLRLLLYSLSFTQQSGCSPHYFNKLKLLDQLSNPIFLFLETFLKISGINSHKTQLLTSQRQSHFQFQTAPTITTLPTHNLCAFQ